VSVAAGADGKSSFDERYTAGVRKEKELQAVQQARKWERPVDEDCGCWWMIVGKVVMMIALTELPTGRARYVCQLKLILPGGAMDAFSYWLVGQSVLPAYK
jgi:hypothetical protein